MTSEDTYEVLHVAPILLQVISFFNPNHVRLRLNIKISQLRLHLNIRLQVRLHLNIHLQVRLHLNIHLQLRLHLNIHLQVRLHLNIHLNLNGGLQVGDSKLCRLSRRTRLSRDSTTILLCPPRH